GEAKCQRTAGSRRIATAWMGGGRDFDIRNQPPGTTRLLRTACIRSRWLWQTVDASYAGRDFDLAMVEQLPSSIDPCGENGEFHTFAFDAPVFSSPVGVTSGEVVQRDGFVFADLPLAS